MSEQQEDNKSYKVTTWIGVALLLSFSIYILFYSIAGEIRKLNRIIDPAELSPPLRAWYMLPRDGIEPWVLYVLTSGVVFLAIALLNYDRKWPSLEPFVFKLTKFVSLPVLFITLAIRPPPVANILGGYFALLSLLFCSVGLWFLSLKTYEFSNRLFDLLFCAVLVPICFVATGPLSSFDYNFILDPALRILHGYRLHEIYLQYDLLLPLLTLPFLALGTDPNLIQLIFQLSYYVFFVCLLIISRKVFFNKTLSVSVVLTLLVTRFFAIQYEPTYAFQLTPLRLDLWLIPFSLFWFYGRFHWSIGLSLGALVIAHRNFGCIYVAAYFACLLTCYISEIQDVLESKDATFREIKITTVGFLKSCAVPVLIPIGCLIASMFIFRDVGISDAARIYGSFGFGFDAINRSSYYWYVPAVISATTIVLFKLKKEIPVRYFSIALFTVFIVVGNSLYFFGRSHESNILAISGSIVLLLYIFIDLLAFHFAVDCRSKQLPKAIASGNILSYGFAISVAPLVIVIMVGYHYSGSIVSRLNVKYENIKTGNFDQLTSSRLDLVELKEKTKASRKLYAMSFGNEFHFYYDGRYVPPSYWFPYAAWVFKKDQVKYLQGLLDDGYYLVYDLSGDNYIAGQKEILADLSFGEVTSSGSFGIIHK